ncbi:hypothetical protein RsS62_02300 [Rhizobium dioscoreae]|nr:hypothetical protein RsS62_02300 [Rhizobium dioscoreae]
MLLDEKRPFKIPDGLRCHETFSGLAAFGKIRVYQRRHMLLPSRELLTGSLMGRGEWQ